MLYTSNESSPTVLVVNDAPDMLELVEFSLKKDGYNALTATNGREALNIAQSEWLDAVVSDVVMPEMDGIELCAELKKNPKTAHIPILLVSALKTGELASLSGFNAGADDYLEIPFHQSQLLVKITKLIERSRIERHYRQIVELSPDIIYTCDKNHRLVSINQAGTRFFGRTAEELRGASEPELLAAHVPNFGGPSAERILEMALTALRARNADGENRVIELRRTHIRDHLNELRGFHCLIRDITERQSVEQALRESERRYRALYQDSPIMYFVLDQHGNVVSVNQSGVERLGYSEAELVGNSVFGVFHPEDRPLVAEQIEKLRQNPYQIGQWEFRKLDKNGNIVIVSENVRLLPQANGESLFLVICEDITERKRTQDALRQSQTQFRTVIENSAVIIFALDKNGTYTLSEGAGLTKLGRRAGEIVGKTVFDVFPDNEQILRNTARALAGEIFTDSGEINGVWFEVRYSPLRGAKGEITGAVGVANDITERIAAERKTAEVIAQLGDSVEREAVINRISNSVRESLQAEDVFRTVVTELGKQLKLDRCHLYIFDDENGVVRSQAQFHTPQVPSVSDEIIPFALADKILPTFRKTGYVAIDDVANEPAITELYQKILGPRNVRSIMFVAVRVREELTGLITLTTVTYQRNWSETDVKLSLAVAAQAGIAIQQAGLFAQAEAVSRREALINRLSTAIRSSLQMPEVLHTATHELGKALAASRVYLRFYNAAQPTAETSPSYEFVADDCHAPAPPSVSYEHPIGQFVLHNKKTVVINDTSDSTFAEQLDVTDFFTAILRKRNVRSVVYCPILVDNQFRGTLCIEQCDRPRQWTESDVALIEAVASQMSLGIAHAELFELTRRAKREWEATFDAMSDGVFIFNRDGRLIRVNRAGAMMENVTPQQLLGKQCCHILSSADGMDSCVIEQVIKTGSGVTVEFTSKLLNRPLLITSEPITDDAGKIAGSVATVRDLYELRAAEAVARERQSLLTYILEGVLEPIFAVDANGQLLWSNKATRETYGIETAEPTRRTFDEMVHPEDRVLANIALASSFQRQPQFYESRFLTDAGETRYAVFNSVPLVEANEVSGVLWFVRDITQQKTALQNALQADKLRALGQLASGVAHDFNNVLAAISGRVQLLQRQITDEKVQRNLQVIQTAAEDAAATVRRIQSFAKQTAAPNFSTVEIVALLRDSIDLTQTSREAKARQRGFRYPIHLDTKDKLYAYGSASELREVFVNLIVNALDAMPSGGALKIVCREENDSLILTFTDEGEGIALEVRERIFEPFFTTKGVYGTGLGLSVSYGIIEQHGGKISVETEVGKGATFTISLPAQKPLQREILPETTPTGKKDLSVLVVDDEEFVREALIEMVEELVTEVVGAESVKTALRELESRRFDVVFTDFSMPEMDGLDLAHEIRQNWSETKTVLVTGYGKAVSLTPERRELVADIIGKPFKFEQLSEALEKITADDKQPEHR